MTLPEPNGWGLTLVEPWMDDALCAKRKVPLEVFFPQGDYTKAIAVCSQCQVAAECLDYAVRTEASEGMYGARIMRKGRPIMPRRAGGRVVVDTPKSRIAADEVRPSFDELYAPGATVDELAAEFGVSASTIRRWRASAVMDVEIPGRVRSPKRAATPAASGSSMYA